jgi:hypothetical protein
MRLGPDRRVRGETLDSEDKSGAADEAQQSIGLKVLADNKSVTRAFLTASGQYWEWHIDRDCQSIPVAIR